MSLFARMSQCANRSRAPISLCCWLSDLRTLEFVKTGWHLCCGRVYAGANVPSLVVRRKASVAFLLGHPVSKAFRFSMIFYDLSISTQDLLICIQENKKCVVNEQTHDTLLQANTMYYKLPRTTISPVGNGLPSPGSIEIPRASNEPISAFEVSTSTP